MNKKACKKCNEVYIINRDNFGNTPSGRFRNTCRSCINKNSQEHHKKNPEQMPQRANKRKEQEKNSLKNYKNSDIKKLLSDLNSQCAYCEKSIIDKYEIDHKTPISRGHR